MRSTKGCACIGEWSYIYIYQTLEEHEHIFWKSLIKKGRLFWNKGKQVFSGRCCLVGQLLDGSWILGQLLDRSWILEQPPDGSGRCESGIINLAYVESQTLHFPR